MKKITTFRYFFHLAWIDMIWLIIWLLHKLISSGKIILPQTMMNNYHSNLIYRFIVFLYNYFTQMNNWMFMAANLNKAILIVNEFKHKQLNKCIHNKILISISIILAVLNIHYLIYFNTNQIFYENKSNQTHQFVYQYLTEPERNFSKQKIDLIRTKSNLLKFNNNQPELFEFYFLNYDSEHFLYKIWSLIRLILFDIIPILINSTSTLIIWRYNQKLTNKKRKCLNKQFILLFFTANLLFILNRIVNTFNIIHYKLYENHQQTDNSKIQISIQIFLNFKQNFSFFVYLFTLKIFRDIISILIAKQKNPNKIKISSKLIIETCRNPNLRSSNNQYLTVYDDRDDKHNLSIKFEKKLNNQGDYLESNLIWIGYSNFFKENSKF